ISYRKLQMQEITERLIKHFKNKEYAVASEKKNYTIHIKDPFHPMDSIQAPLTSGIPKNCSAKLRKPSQFSYSNDMQFNETETSHIDEINQECANYDSLEDLSLSEISINNIENTSRFAEPHSIQNDATFTTKRSLEELFLEKEYA
ncbi:5408_t:CDS:2, partial [Scutellospora calospora]